MAKPIVISSQETPRTSITMQADRDLVRAFKTDAVLRGITLTTLLQRLLELYLNDMEVQEKVLRPRPKC